MGLQSKDILLSAIITLSVASLANTHAATLVSYDFSLPDTVSSTPLAPAASDIADLGATGYSATVFGVAGSALAVTGGNIGNAPSPAVNVSYRTGVHDYPAGLYNTYPTSAGQVSFSAPANSTPITGAITHSGNFTVGGGQWTSSVVDLNSTKWVGFSVTSDAGQSLALSALSFNTQFYNSGTGSGTVVYSLDGVNWTALKLSNNSTTFTANGSSDSQSWNAISYNLTGINELQNIDGTVSFRWYLAATTTSGSRAFRFDDIKLDGLAAPVPESASLLLLSSGILACLKRKKY